MQGPGTLRKLVRCGTRQQYTTSFGQVKSVVRSEPGVRWSVKIRIYHCKHVREYYSRKTMEVSNKEGHETAE